MNPYFYLLGHPYNPVSNDYFEPLPSGAKVTGFHKKIIKTNYNSMDKEDFLNFIYGSLMKMLEDEDSGNLLYIDFDYDQIDNDEFKRSLSEKYDFAKKLNKGVGKLVLSYLPPYQDVIDEYHINSNGKITPKWFLPLHRESSFENGEAISIGVAVDKTMSLEDGMPFEPNEENPTDDDFLTEQEKRIFKAILLFFESRDTQYNLFAKFFVSKAIKYTRDEKDFKKAAELIWCLARKEDSPEIFLMFYSYYKEVFTAKRFPYLHLQNIKDMASRLFDNDNDNGMLSTVDNRKISSVIEKINSITEEGNHIQSIFRINQLLSNTENLPSGDKFIRFIQNQIDDSFSPIMKNENLHSDIKILIEALPRLNKRIKFDGNTSLFKMLLPLVNFIPRLSSVCILTDKKTKEFINELTEKDSLNEEAKELGKDPLANIDRLKEISDIMNDISESEKLFQHKIEEAISDSIEILAREIDNFNNSHNVDSSETHEDSDLQKQVLSLSKEINEVKKENTSLKEKVHNKEQIIQASKKKAQQTIKTIVSYEDLSSLISNTNVESIVNILNKMHGTIILSGKARQEIKSLKNFQKHDLLIQKLGILSSPDFISSYMSKGSSECFNYLTNKELSFQESKTVKDRNERTFIFDDGKSRDCKAHLKICSSTKEQHQLRIYFKIENNKIYIGMITKHLDCA